MSSEQYYTVGQVADLLGVPPWRVSSLFYSRKISGPEFPLIGGRRLIPCERLDVVRMFLARQGVRTRAPAGRNGACKRS